MMEKQFLKALKNIAGECDHQLILASFSTQGQSMQRHYFASSQVNKAMTTEDDYLPIGDQGETIWVWRSFQGDRLAITNGRIIAAGCL